MGSPAERLKMLQQRIVDLKNKKVVVQQKLEAAEQKLVETVKEIEASKGGPEKK